MSLHSRRLAIDSAHHRTGLGRALFRDAGLRVLQAADIIGVRGLLVAATSDEAQAFYLALALGMSVSPLDPTILRVTLTELLASLRGSPWKQQRTNICHLKPRLQNHSRQTAQVPRMQSWPPVAKDWRCRPILLKLTP